MLPGITQQELEEYFREPVEHLQKENQHLYSAVIQTINDEYCSWDGVNYVSDPFVLLTLFTKMQFGDYWYQSATPAFLMKLIKQ